MRIVLIGFIIVLLVLSCGLAVRYNNDADYAREELNSERYKRMVSEESVLAANQQVEKLKAELKRAVSQLETTESALEAMRAVNDDYKLRLDKSALIYSNLNKRIEELQALGGQ